jgi:hypothetical protein
LGELTLALLLIVTYSIRLGLVQMVAPFLVGSPRLEIGYDALAYTKKLLGSLVNGVTDHFHILLLVEI